MSSGSGSTRPSFVTSERLSDFIISALREDIGEGDHSTLGSVPESLQCKAQLLVKEDCILAGIELAEIIFNQYDPALRVQKFHSDGDKARKADIAFIVEGPARSVLTTERLVLNCMQRMSGIATFTGRLCALVEGTGAAVMDTRKTTPNFRMLEKWAVKIGGGQNHRYALYDMVMLKDNHVDMAGGISKAIQAAVKYLASQGKAISIEVETRTLEEVREVLETGGVQVIMLDNMSLSDMKTAVALVGGKYKTEASGGITEDTIKAVAACGVDYISIGALTHSVRSIDLSLKVVK